MVYMGKKTLFLVMGVALLLASCGIKTSLLCTWKPVSGIVDDAFKLPNGDVLVTTKDEEYSPSDKAYVLNSQGKVAIQFEKCGEPKIMNDMLCVWFNDEDKTRFYDLQSYKLVCTVNGFVANVKTEDRNFISVYETKENTFLIKTDPTGVVKWADSLDSMSVDRLLVQDGKILVGGYKENNRYAVSLCLLSFDKYAGCSMMSFNDFVKTTSGKVEYAAFMVDYSTGRRLSKKSTASKTDVDFVFSADSDLMLKKDQTTITLFNLTDFNKVWSVKDQLEDIHPDDSFTYAIASPKQNQGFSRLMDMKTGSLLPEVNPDYYPFMFHPSSKNVVLVDHAAKDNKKDSHYLFSALDPETGKVLWDKKMTSLQVDDLRDYKTHFVTLKNPQTGIIHAHECIFLSEKMGTYDRIELVDVENGQTLWQMNKDHNISLYECQIVGNDILLVYKSRMEKVDIATGIIKRRFWSDEGFVGFDTPDYPGSSRYIMDGLMVVRYKDHSELFDLNSFESVMKTNNELSFKKTSEDTILFWNAKNLYRYSIVEK